MPRKSNNRLPMKNITINIPDIYDENIQKLIKLNWLPSRSEAIRLALKEFLSKEYSENLDLLGYFIEKKVDKSEDSNG